MRVAGVDGCPGGWVAAVLDLAALSFTVVAVGDAAGFRALGDQVGVDIPIGLPSGPERRAADAAARRRLPGRGSSVFPTPVRGVLDARDYLDACAVSRAACGRALSKQSWLITPKIAEVDAVIGPADAAWLAEVHPEVSFAAMAGGMPLPSKKLVVGRSEREALVTAWLRGLGVAANARDLTASAPGTARPDDVLDACACAWTAWRWSRGEAETLGDVDARDERGLPMRILV